MLPARFTGVHAKVSLTSLPALCILDPVQEWSGDDRWQRAPRTTGPASARPKTEEAEIPHSREKREEASIIPTQTRHDTDIRSLLALKPLSTSLACSIQRQRPHSACLSLAKKKKKLYQI